LDKNTLPLKFSFVKKFTMKRFLLFSIVIAAILWTLFSVYDLFLQGDNALSPENIFCEQDESILLINRKAETESVDYLKVVANNPFKSAVESFDIKPYARLKIYMSAQRPIVILEKESSWKQKQIEVVKTFFNEAGTNFKKEQNILLISKDFKPCPSDSSLNFFIEGDKKASANFWSLKEDQWRRTDVYALEKGFYEYRSSSPNDTYGKAVNDVASFSSVLPSNISTYDFKERFYAYNTDTVYASNIMNSWVDIGFVSATYQEDKILVTDYRSKQQPSLILIEKSTSEDSVKLMDDIKSFSGFQFTSEFPSRPKGRVYAIELEDKVVFTEKESTARQVLVDYQLGKTLALNQTRKEQFFGGLPTRVNRRSIDQNEKESLTWKEALLFEVSTKPPQERTQEVEKTTWSFGLDFHSKMILPIPDHLRNGTSVFVYDKEGNYKLIGPNGKLIWKNSLKVPITGTPIVIDVFENDKHQVLCKTEKSVHLIDLNGNSVGGFPYKSDHIITTDISEFVWNGTKRFLFGNEKGEVTVLNSSGQELNIIQTGRHPISNTPYALNIAGNLRCWVLNSENEQFLGYLETPAAPSILDKSKVDFAIKTNGIVKTFFAKDGKIYYETRSNQTAQLIAEGKIIKVTQNYIYTKKNNSVVIYNQKNELVKSISLPYNEIGSVDNFQYKDRNYTVIMDYLQNKINLYDENNEEMNDFPKEGREKAVSYFNEQQNILSIYTIISKSIVCYKVNL
jgi:hypothetical protein